MNYRNLAIVLISIIGIYTLAQGFYQLSFLFSILLFGLENSNLTLVQAIVNALLLVSMYASVGTVLLLFRKRLAGFIVEGMDIATHNVDVYTLQAVGFSILGLYFVVDGLSTLRLIAFGFYEAVNWASIFRDSGFWRFVLGFFLFIGAKGLVKVWMFLRRPGTKNSH